MDITIWTKIDKEIKDCIAKNGYIELIAQDIVGELNECIIKTSYGYEILFCGNNEAYITVDVDGKDYTFSYVVDSYGETQYLTNF